MQFLLGHLEVGADALVQRLQQVDLPVGEGFSGESSRDDSRRIGRGVQVQAGRRFGTLQVFAEAVEPPDQQTAVPFGQGLTKRLVNGGLEDTGHGGAEIGQVIQRGSPGPGFRNIEIQIGAEVLTAADHDGFCFIDVFSVI